MVRLDDSASVVTVAVTVSIGAINVSDSLAFAVETEHSIKAKSLLCLVKRIAVTSLSSLFPIRFVTLCDSHTLRVNLLN